MKKSSALSFLSFLMLMFYGAAEALAQGMPVIPAGSATFPAPDTGSGGLGAGLAAGLAVVGAGIGIGLIGAKSNESVARQPEMAGRIFINMILTAALVEGVALFAVVVGLLKFPY